MPTSFSFDINQDSISIGEVFTYDYSAKGVNHYKMRWIGGSNNNWSDWMNLDNDSCVKCSSVVSLSEVGVYYFEVRACGGSENGSYCTDIKSDSLNVPSAIISTLIPTSFSFDINQDSISMDEVFTYDYSAKGVNHYEMRWISGENLAWSDWLDLKNDSCSKCYSGASFKPGNYYFEVRACGDSSDSYCTNVKSDFLNIVEFKSKSLVTKKYSIGIVPSLINSKGGYYDIFDDNVTWPNSLTKVDAFGTYDVFIDNPNWLVENKLAIGEKLFPMDLKKFSSFMNSNDLNVTLEYGYWFGEDISNGVDPSIRIIEILDKFYASGKNVSIIYLDGPFWKVYAKGGYSYDEGISFVADAVEKIKTAYPDIEVSIIVNFPNWDFTSKYPGYLGDFGEVYCGGKICYYKDLFDDFLDEIDSRGLKIGALVLDNPYNYYKSLNTNDEKLLAVQDWLSSKGIDFGLIINSDTYLTGKAGDEVYYYDSLKYVNDLATLGVFPDRFIIESWYEVPESHLSEDDPYSFMYVAKSVSKEIHVLFPYEDGGFIKSSYTKVKSFVIDLYNDFVN
ncbi:MAG: hypothetical protein V1888_00765 [archaeon]